MLERSIVVINPLGLHARAAAKLVRLAGAFESRLTLFRDELGIEADAKAILSVLHIAASYGVTLRVTADGPDESAALTAVEDLFVAGFGEI